MQPKRKRINPDTIVLLKQIGIGVLVLVVVALLVTGIWYGTRVPSLTISEIHVSGGETIEHGRIEKIVQTQLEGMYLGLIPRTFAWMYPLSDIQTALERVERIYHVHVVRVSGTTVEVTFDEYVPQALWCDPDEVNKCVFLDSHGYAFAHAPKLSGGTLLRFIKTGQEPALQELVTEEELLNNSFALVKKLAERGWFVSQVEIDQAEDAFLKVVGGGELKVTFRQTPEETVENLFVILASYDFAHIKPGKFQYIDLRYGNKVFVNEELAAPEVETASSVASGTEPLAD